MWLYVGNDWNGDFLPGNRTSYKKRAVQIDIYYVPPPANIIVNGKLTTSDASKAKQDIYATKGVGNVIYSVVHCSFIAYIDILEDDDRRIIFTWRGEMLYRCWAFDIINIKDCQVRYSVLNQCSSTHEAKPLGSAGNLVALSQCSTTSPQPLGLRILYVPIACFPFRENRADARSASVFSGCRTSGIGCGGGGSSATGNGVIYGRAPVGGPVAAAIILLDCCFQRRC